MLSQAVARTKVGYSFLPAMSLFRDLWWTCTHHVDKKWFGMNFTGFGSSFTARSEKGHGHPKPNLKLPTLCKRNAPFYTEIINLHKHIELFFLFRSRMVLRLSLCTFTDLSNVSNFVQAQEMFLRRILPCYRSLFISFVCHCICMSTLSPIDVTVSLSLSVSTASDHF